MHTFFYFLYLLRYVLRRLVYNIPVYLGIILLVMAALRVHDPVWMFLGKNASQARYEQLSHALGLDENFLVQYGNFVWDIVCLRFNVESWDKPGTTVGELLGSAAIPTLRTCALIPLLLPGDP